MEVAVIQDILCPGPHPKPALKPERITLSELIERGRLRGYTFRPTHNELYGIKGEDPVEVDEAGLALIGQFRNLAIARRRLTHEIGRLPFRIPAHASLRVELAVARLLGLSFETLHTLGAYVWTYKDFEREVDDTLTLLREGQFSLNRLDYETARAGAIRQADYQEYCALVNLPAAMAG